MPTLMGVRGEAADLLKVGHPEPSVDDAVLGGHIRLDDPLLLAFVAHMHGFLDLDGPLRRGEPLQYPSTWSAEEIGPNLSSDGGLGQRFPDSSRTAMAMALEQFR
jgi:hypothetical protein